MTQLAVGTQADVMALASPVVEAQVDREFARAAAPANLLQLEGLLRVSPKNDVLLLLAARSWASYAYGFIEDDMEEAELSGDLERADHERDRARAMYLRAKELGFRLLGSEASELADVSARDPDQLQAVLQKEFREREWAPALFWTGYAWGSAINLSRDDPALLADLPFATLLVERSLELDENYYHAAAHVFLGVLHSSRGPSIGGNPEEGKRHFERALDMTKREALMVQLNYARAYAVQMQDRKLFDDLLSEVKSASVAPGSAVSLANTLAQRRARRLSAQADLLILPPPPSPPEPAPAAGDDSRPEGQNESQKDSPHEAS